MSDVTGGNDRIDTTRLQRMSRAYAETAVLWAAIDLDLFTAVADGASDVDSVAERCGLSALNAQRLVTCCLALDLIRRSDEGRLTNAPDTDKFLVKGAQRFAGPWMTFTRGDVDGWMSLTEKLRSMEAPARLGMYSDLTVDAARKYHRATASIGRGAGRRFARTVDLGGRHRMMDLGGGSGAYSIEVCLAHPNMSAVVFDLPPVTVVCEEYLEAAGMSDRVSTHGGDFTADELPTGCDVAVMASNLPIYDEVNIALVVGKAFAALEPGGEFHLVGEMLNDDGVGPLDPSLWGMQEILYNSGGKAHSRSQCVGYLEGAGFVDVDSEEFVPGVLERVFGRKPR